MSAVAPIAARRSLADAAYETLRRRVLDNIYPPGHRALEAELADDLGISRTPLREALVRLEREGLVEVIPRHGVRVLPISPTDMREVYEILTALESLAAELVARRQPSAAEIEPLVAASQAMSDALGADDLDAWARADERFHRHLVELAGNRLLELEVQRFGDRVHRARMVTLRLRPKPITSTQEHMQLVERIRAGDAVGAYQVNRAHRERASRELVALFERHRFHEL